MPSRLRVACVQIDASDDLDRNRRKILASFHAAVRKGARLIAYPENFYWRGKAADMAAVAAGTSKLTREFAQLAQKHGVYILMGSVLEKAPRGKFYNTSFLISPRGKVIARYRKIHLFDSKIKGARTMESKTIAPGKKPVKVLVEGIPAGLTICYDLRFPELFRALSSKGARLFFVPANFTETTGKVHWETLLKARAVENLAFVIAPGQSGTHPESGIRSFGTSLIIDPWGVVLARGKHTGEQVITADLDFKVQRRLRECFPVLKHRRNVS